MIEETHETHIPPHEYPLVLKILGIFAAYMLVFFILVVLFRGASLLEATTWTNGKYWINSLVYAVIFTAAYWWYNVYKKRK